MRNLWLYTTTTSPERHPIRSFDAYTPTSNLTVFTGAFDRLLGLGPLGFILSTSDKNATVSGPCDLK